MHEAGIIQSILNTAEEKAIQAGATRIEVIRLNIGMLTGVVDEAFQHAFEVLKQGTLASGATLEVNYIPGTVFCTVCQQEFETSELLCICPVCSTPGHEIRSGLEMEFLSFDMVN
jgi:hydrogenase nickel incorporation protein HypA/HybF